MFFAVFNHLNDAVEIFLGFYFTYISDRADMFQYILYFEKKIF